MKKFDVDLDLEEEVDPDKAFECFDTPGVKPAYIGCLVGVSCGVPFLTVTCYGVTEAKARQMVIRDAIEIGAKPKHSIEDEYKLQCQLWDEAVEYKLECRRKQRSIGVRLRRLWDWLKTRGR